METIAECVGGPCDGVQLDPDNENEPDDWPEIITLECRRTGRLTDYALRKGRPKNREGVRIYLYDAVPDEVLDREDIREWLKTNDVPVVAIEPEPDDESSP